VNLRTRPREEPEINLTSLIDVVLLLLVFFMVSTSFLKATEIRLQLPQAEAVPREEPAAEIEIMSARPATISSTGRNWSTAAPRPCSAPSSRSPASAANCRSPSAPTAAPRTSRW
jgi:biopolymer transport protein ExbD